MPLRIWEFFHREPLSLELLIAALTLVVCVPPGIFYAGRIIRWWKKRSAAARLEEKGFNRDVVDEIKENYIRPDCQQLDPAESGNLLDTSPVRVGPFRWLREFTANPLARPFGLSLRAMKIQLTGAHTEREDLFLHMDRQMSNPRSEKFVLLLADTGMGKTAFMANYLAHRLLRARRDQLDIEYLPLNVPDAPRRVREIEGKADGRVQRTILLLDGLDEDPLAMERPGERLLELLQVSQSFYRIVVTSRTQLFGRDNRVPAGTRIIKSPLQVANAGHETHEIASIYFSPFNLWQEDAYLRRRFWRPKNLRHARNAVKKMDDLSARPLLLSNIDATFSQKRKIDRASQLYELLITKWIAWEGPFIDDPKAVREFLECLAVELYTRWANERGGVITDNELPAVAARFQTKLPKSTDICGRSLLNRDSRRDLKFAHWSILEYLFVARFRKFPDQTVSIARRISGEVIPWSEQMKKFYFESTLDSWEEDQTPVAGYEKADLSGLENVRGLTPFKKLRSAPTKILRPDLDPGKASRDLKKMAEPTSLPHLYCEVHAIPGDAATSSEIWSAAYSAVRFERVGTRRVPDVDPIVHEALRNLSSKAVVVIDHAVGLVWEVPGSRLPALHEMAKARAACLSVAHFAGFSDWHLPTLEEVSSLVSLLREDYPSAFDAVGRSIWTADAEGVRGIGVDLVTCEIHFYDHLTDLCPRAVCVASLASRTYAGTISARAAA